MGYIFIIPGGLAVIVGGFWTFVSLAPSLRGVADGGSIAAALIVAMPGASIFLAGLLLMAAGAALLTLASIERYAKACFEMMRDRRS